MIEGAGLPDNCKIETRRPVRNDDGIQIAEMDIVIATLVGTLTSTTLIECRDRPSEGSAPASWIEQLAGRRDRLRIDTVVAVSSTGFSPGAIDFAREKNIRLRTFDALTYDDVRSWIPRKPPIIISTLNLVSVQVVLAERGVPQDSQDVQLIREERPINTSDAFILHKPTGEHVSLQQLWDRYRLERIGQLGPAALGQKRLVHISVATDFLDDYVVPKDGCEFVFHKLDVDVEISTVQPDIPLTDIANYSGDGKILRTIAHWKGPDDGDIREFSVILTPRREI